MLIPIGIFASSGSRATGAFDLLETAIVGSGGAASVTFSNVTSKYASLYEHLQIRYTARVSGADGIASVLINYNATTTNYRDHVLYGTGGGIPVTSSNSASTFAYGGVVAKTNTTSVFGAGVIDFLDPFNTSKTKVHRTLSGMFVTGSSFQNFVSLQSGLWNQTTAITEIKLTGEGASFQENSRFSLYGIKATA